MHIPVIDWAVVFGILTLAGGFIVRVVIPGVIHVKALMGGDSGTTVKVQAGGNGNSAAHVAEAEWRGKLGEQLNETLMHGVAGATVKELAESIAKRLDAAVSAQSRK